MEGWTARTLELVGDIEGHSDSYLEWGPTRSAACFCHMSGFTDHDMTQRWTSDSLPPPFILIMGLVTSL